MQFDHGTKSITLNDIICHHKEHEGARRLKQKSFGFYLCVLRELRGKNLNNR